MSKEQEEIKEWLENLKFKKNIFGFIDETDVWDKINELNQKYEKLLLIESQKKYE